MTDRELDIRCNIIIKHLHAGIDEGVYQNFDYLITYGFWAKVKYKGELWHYCLDETQDLDRKEIDWITITSKIGPSQTMEVTIEEWEYLWSFYNNIWREKVYLMGNI